MRVVGQLFLNVWEWTVFGNSCKQKVWRGEKSSHLNWNGTAGIAETTQNEIILCEIQEYAFFFQACQISL